MTRRSLAILVALAALVALALTMCAVPVGAQTRLAVRAVWAGDGARVTWPAVRGAAVVSIGRPGGRQPLGRPSSPAATVWSQGRTSLDAGLVLRPGDAVEVRVWGARGELLATGAARLRWVVYVPSTQKSPHR
jgi:hypothetical protein